MEHHPCLHTKFAQNCNIHTFFPFSNYIAFGMSTPSRTIISKCLQYIEYKGHLETDDHNNPRTAAAFQPQYGGRRSTDQPMLIR